MIVVQVLVMALPIALVWTLISDQFTLSSLALGYLIGVAFAWGLREQARYIKPARLPLQIVEATIYLLLLMFDILRSGIDVARRVLSRDMRLNPAIIAVPVQRDHQVMAAFSALAITITPGQLVVDFDDNQTMYVHCLDVEMSAASLDSDQTDRIQRFERIGGQ